MCRTRTVLITIVLLIGLSAAVLAADPAVSTTSHPLNSCGAGTDIPGGKHYLCTTWGPVTYSLGSSAPEAGPASYITNLPQGMTFPKECDPTKKPECQQRCGCIKDGSIILNIADPLGSTDVITALTGTITQMVAGSGTLVVSDASQKPLASVGTGTTPTTPSLTGNPIKLNAGQNMFGYYHSSVTTDTCAALQSGILFTYSFDVISDGDYNDTQCAAKGGVWSDVASEGHKCCGDDTGTTQDFLMVSYDSGGKPEAMCINSTTGWKWIAEPVLGKPSPVCFGGENSPFSCTTSGKAAYEAVYTDDGALLCGPLTPTRGSIGMPSYLDVTSTATKESTDEDNPDIAHEYVCAQITPTSRKALECNAGTAFSDHAVIPGTQANATDGTTPYCGSNSSWVTSFEEDADGCAAAGFIWTGSMCCGDQPHEYYNDPMNVSSEPEHIADYAPQGCWDATPVQGFGDSGEDKDGNSIPLARFPWSVVPNMDFNIFKTPWNFPNLSILNYNGTFQGCMLPGDGRGLLQPDGTWYHGLDWAALRHWCDVETVCGNDKTTKWNVSAFCEITKDTTCAAKCSEGECVASDPKCNENGQWGTQDADTGEWTWMDCPPGSLCDNKGLNGAAICDESATNPSNTTYYCSIQGVLAKPGSNGCAAALFDETLPQGKRWPTYIEAKNCFKTKKNAAPEPKKQKTTSKKCFVVNQKVYNILAKGTGAVKAMDRCTQWLNLTGVKTSTRGAVSTDNSTNVWYTTVTSYLDGKCDCGVKVTPLVVLDKKQKNPVFEVRCLKKLPGSVKCDEGIPVPVSATALNPAEVCKFS